MELRRFQNKIEFLWVRKTTPCVTSVTQLKCYPRLWQTRHRTNAQAFCNNLGYFDEAILEAWSLKIACYFYTDISGDSNGNFGGKKRGISDCRVWSILKNCARESHKVDPICAKPKHCKTRFVFPTKARNTEILSGGFTDHFSGYWMYWLFVIFWLPGN